MKLEYYFFALFIAALACLVAILCKVLFADNRQQKKMLDEKEKKLLDLYRSVENIMEEFGDQAKAALDEMREYESRAAIRTVSHTAAPPPTPPAEKKDTKERLPRADEADAEGSGIRKAASDALERAEKLAGGKTSQKTPATAASAGGDKPVFQRLFDDTAEETKPPANETEAKQQRTDKIISMSKDGKKVAQIAKELGITQNEVKLVIELGGKP
jgi:DNA-binding NarL/FixJ family response regulator